MFQGLCNQNNQITWAVFQQPSFYLAINNKKSWPILCLAEVGYGSIEKQGDAKVPLMWCAMEGIHRGNMMVAHLLLGFGKDHNLKNWMDLPTRGSLTEIVSTCGMYHLKSFRWGCTTQCPLLMPHLYCSCEDFSQWFAFALEAAACSTLVQYQHVSDAKLSIHYLVGAWKFAIDSTGFRLK